MGQKLSNFLRVLASGLSPQAAQANTQMFMAEEAEGRKIAGEQRLEAKEGRQQSFKTKISQMGLYATIAKENPTNMEIQHRMGKKIKEVAGDDPGLLEAAMGYVMEDEQPADELGGGRPPTTIFEGIEGKKKATTELTKLQKQRSHLETLPSTPKVARDIQNIDNRIAKITTITGRTAEDITASQKGKLKVGGIEGETSLRQNVGEINNLIETVSSPDFIGGLTGASAQALNSASAQVTQLFGGENFTNEDGSINPRALEISKETDSRLRRAAAKGDLANSQTLQLAFVLAKSLNPDGKISDADVRQAEAILGKSADPKIRKNLLEDVQRRLISNYNIQEKVKAKALGQKYTPLTMKDITSGAKTVDEIDTDTLADDLIQKHFKVSP